MMRLGTDYEVNPKPKPKMGGGRTWIVSAIEHPTRTEEVDHLARSAGWGLSYLTGEDLPPYLGIWTDSNGNNWHLFSDYTDSSHHQRFGWRVAEAASPKRSGGGRRG